jgi:hypothetical protein
MYLSMDRLSLEVRELGCLPSMPLKTNGSKSNSSSAIWRFGRHGWGFCFCFKSTTLTE